MDLGTAGLQRQFADRLDLIEAYDRAGFYAYHLAEHHCTPLGIASSPGLFLAAVAQRTRTLRFGPLVYTLSLYHPLRVLDEICMLDQMSGGRLELGVGRGISPYELGYWGVAAEDAQGIYEEALAIILQGLTSPSVTFEGKFFKFRDVPMVLTPHQRPHPPLWYGVARPDTVPWTVAHRVNIVCNGNVATVRRITDRYRAEWRAAGHDPARNPLMGMARHIVVADTDKEALDAARPAYKLWRDHLYLLWDQHGSRPVNLVLPDDYDEAQRAGIGIAGSPQTVLDTLAPQIRAAGINYFVCRLAFGNLSPAISRRSLDLFTAKVMPSLAALAEAA
jgi:alkanesulfonate monooxygenase SsuD/methylene tetrahydromethanopterin reductase-like flavin-dependent oxidoreductase (luciferase family)